MTEREVNYRLIFLGMFFLLLFFGSVFSYIFLVDENNIFRSIIVVGFLILWFFVAVSILFSVAMLSFKLKRYVFRVALEMIVFYVLFFLFVTVVFVAEYVLVVLPFELLELGKGVRGSLNVFLAIFGGIVVFLTMTYYFHNFVLLGFYERILDKMTNQGKTLRKLKRNENG